MVAHHENLQAAPVDYPDGKMFWGHSVVVNSMDGIAFTDTHAEIFG